MTDRIHAGDDRDEPDLSDVTSDADPVEGVDEAFDALTVGPDDQQEDTAEYPLAERNTSACRFCREEFDTLCAERKHICDGRRRLDYLDDLADQLVAPQMHEVGAKWLFDQNGLAPYFAIVTNFDRCLQDEDGSDDVGTFEAAGDTWHLNHDENKVKYWEGKIKTRPGDSGDAYYEYNIGLVAEDSVGRRRVNFQFRPALPYATHVETDEEIQSLPSELPEGVRVQVDGANVDLEDYIEILRELVRAMDVNPEYFQEDQLHEWSRCFNQAPYVRIDRLISERRIVSGGGLLDRLSSHAAEQRGAGRYEWDNREIMGHRNTVAMDSQNLEPFVPGHTVGKLLKSYHMKNPEENVDPSRPTTQPKLEVQYSTEFSFGDFESVPWSDPKAFDAYDLREELVEWLLNCLDWAGITLTPDPDIYVADEYFGVDELDEDLAPELYPDPMPALEETKQDLAEHHVLGKDLTDSDMEVLKILAEGGSMHHEELAEASGTSTSTVYRAAKKLGDILRNNQGVFQLSDEVIQERISDLFASLERTAEWVDRSINEIVREGDVELAQDSPLAKWMRTYGVSLQRDGDGYESWSFDVQVGRYDLAMIRRVLRSGYHAARASGVIVADRFIDASFSWTTNDGDRERREKAFTITSPQVRALGMPVGDIG